MRIWRGVDDVPGDWGRSVVTIGVFDGIHRGHRELIDTAVAAAARRKLPAVLVTFDPHPLAVVAPPAPPRLSTIEQRAALARAHGIDEVFALEFTPELSRLTPEEFVADLLAGRLHADEVVVGENFTFGHGAAGDVATLTELGRRYGFTVTAVGLLHDGSTAVSSSHVRECLAAGDMAGAAAALGRSYRVSGTVVRGAQRGRDLGFPTANIDVADGAAVPADGVYAGWFTRFDPSGPGGLEVGRAYPAAVSVGTNPTFDAEHRTVEAFVLDQDVDLYGARAAVDFVARLRGMDRFDGIDELIAAMDGDVARTRALLGPPQQAHGDN